MMVKKYIIKEQEYGYLVKDGWFAELLTAGRYSCLNMSGYEVQAVPITGKVKACRIPEETLMKDEEFASRIMKAVPPDEYIALRFVNKVYREVITKPETLYWNIFEKNEFQFIDIAQLYVEDTLPRMCMDLTPSKCCKKIVIEDGEIGLLYFGDCYEKKLDAGTYYSQNCGKEITCKVFNMKTQQLGISGQEILTANKVAARLNVICNHRIINPEKLVQIVEGMASQLYAYAQLKLREYVGRYRLNELLEQKEEIGRFVLNKLKKYQEEYCVEIIGAGIKDIILPGKTRKIVNTAPIAEKKTQANVITRREEVASTRNLLNIARLVDENRTLFKLKEMEYLKKVCGKVGSVSFNSGKDVLGQLAELVEVQD